MDLSETPVVQVIYPEPFPKECKPSKAQLERLARTLQKQFEMSTEPLFWMNTEIP